MFTIGELVVHSEHGVCKIDDIKDMTFGGKTRTYYELHPIDKADLKISIPVDNSKSVMYCLMEKDEAIEILDSFNQPGIEWISDVRQRNKEYNNLIKTANRTDISKIVNTLMRKKEEASADKKQLSEQDKKLLQKTQQLLYEELALTLDKSYDEIENKIKSMLKVS